METCIPGTPWSWDATPAPWPTVKHGGGNIAVVVGVVFLPRGQDVRSLVKEDGAGPFVVRFKAETFAQQ